MSQVGIELGLGLGIGVGDIPGQSVVGNPGQEIPTLRSCYCENLNMIMLLSKQGVVIFVMKIVTNIPRQMP